MTKTVWVPTFIPFTEKRKSYRYIFLFRTLMFSLFIDIMKLHCFIADVQLLILECTVSWQPIRRERPPPRLLSVSGVSVSSFLLISFLFLFLLVAFK